MWQAVLPFLLARLVTADNAVSCTTSEVNLLQNPSFESGSMSEWKTTLNAVSVVGGSDAADGDYYL